jgi:hypothetical protein
VTVYRWETESARDKLKVFGVMVAMVVVGGYVAWFVLDTLRMIVTGQ